MARYKYHTLIKEIVGDGHYTVDDLYDAIRKKGQKASLATIYRTLEYMVTIEDLTIFSLDGSKTYYEKNKGFHAHLIDVDKDTIVDIHFPTEKLQFPAGFHLNNSVVNFFGSREGNVPHEQLDLLHTISIVDTDGQEKLGESTTSETRDVNRKSNDFGDLRKIFREF